MQGNMAKCVREERVIGEHEVLQGKYWEGRTRGKCIKEHWEVRTRVKYDMEILGSAYES
jgi:hypothetical protein